MGPLLQGPHVQSPDVVPREVPLFRTLRLEIDVESLPEQQHSGFRGVELL